VMNAVLLFGNNTSFSTNNCCFVFCSAILIFIKVLLRQSRH
jgi:hypothetical protein